MLCGGSGGRLLLLLLHCSLHHRTGRSVPHTKCQTPTSQYVHMSVISQPSILHVNAGTSSVSFTPSLLQCAQEHVVMVYRVAVLRLFVELGASASISLRISLPHNYVYAPSGSLPMFHLVQSGMLPVCVCVSLCVSHTCTSPGNQKIVTMAVLPCQNSPPNLLCPVISITHTPVQPGLFCMALDV